MTTTATPLFDQLNEIVSFIRPRTIFLFKHYIEFDSTTHYQDWFLENFSIYWHDVSGQLPPFEKSRLFKLATEGYGLPNGDKLRRELRHALTSCVMPRQVEWLCSEIGRTCQEITKITNFILNDFPTETFGWIEKFQIALNTANDGAWVERFVARTGKDKFELYTYRLNLANAIQYLKCLDSLADKIYIFALELKEFSDPQAQSLSYIASPPKQGENNTGPKRGPYGKVEKSKEDSLKRYEQVIYDNIHSALSEKPPKSPDQHKILKAAKEDIMNRFNIPFETFRQYLRLAGTTPMKLYGEIHHKVSSQKSLFIKDMS